MFFSPYRDAVGCFLLSHPHPQTSQALQNGLPHPSPRGGFPRAGLISHSAQRTGFQTPVGSVGRPRAPRAAETHFLWPSPRVLATRVSASQPSSAPTRRALATNHPPRRRDLDRHPDPSRGGPTGGRAAAGTGAGAAAPAPSGSGRRRGNSSLPAPAGRGRARPAPGGSEAPAAAAAPAPTPWQGRRQWRAEGEASDRCRSDTVPPELGR